MQSTRDRQGPDGMSELRNPRCAFCDTGRGVRIFYLTHGVQIHLCRAHREGEFLRRRGGRVFTTMLFAHWRRRYGTVGARRVAAAKTHRLRVRGKLASDGPGSYSWALVRYEAEARFAAGDDPLHVINALHAENAGGKPDAPSERTMRRWFFEGRWLVDPRVWLQRLSRRPKRWSPNRTVQISTSALGMCIFQPGLAVARQVGVSDAIHEATATVRRRLIRRRTASHRPL